MKAMGNPILGFLWVRLHPGRYMLNLVSPARGGIIGTTIVDMDVSSKVNAVMTAHHRGTVVVGCELVSVDFKSSTF